MPSGRTVPRNQDAESCAFGWIVFQGRYRSMLAESCEPERERKLSVLLAIGVFVCLFVVYIGTNSR